MEYLKIGFIKKPHGFKGFLNILPLTDDLNRYKKIKTIYLKINDKFQEEEIEKTIIAKNSIILKLKNYNDIKEIEKFRSIYIFINRKDGLSLNTDEYYLQDLIDCDFYYNDKLIGKVINIKNFGSCDLVLVKYDNNEVYYPFLKKYIDLIDIKNKKIIVNQYEGFFD